LATNAGLDIPELLRHVPGIECVLNSRDRLRLSSRFGQSAGYEHLPGRDHALLNDSSDPDLEELITIVGSNSQNEYEEEKAEEDIHEHDGAESKSVAVPIPDEAHLGERNFALEHVGVDSGI